jgi:sugar phosphate isomerase/epimerase
MRLAVFKTLWGFEGSYEEAARQAREAGFSGLEGPVPLDAGARDELTRVLDEHRLAYIGEVCTAGGYVPRRQATVAEHLASLEDHLKVCAELRPRFVNCIGGCDAWPLEDSLAFFTEAMALAARHGATISFETHRSRSLFNPWVTRRIVERLPGMRLTCDYSHWCVVCERLLDSETEILEFLASRAHHIHARVGYDQGPQVPHPAAPEFAGELAAHQRWWETIWASQHARGYGESTLTPEFGPDGYLHRLPFTRAPVADLWEINRWMADTERAHFEDFRERVAGSGNRASEPVRPC